MSRLFNKISLASSNVYLENCNPVSLNRFNKLDLISSMYTQLVILQVFFASFSVHVVCSISASKKKSSACIRSILFLMVLMFFSTILIGRWAFMLFSLKGSYEKSVIYWS